MQLCHFWCVQPSISKLKCWWLQLPASGNSFLLFVRSSFRPLCRTTAFFRKKQTNSFFFGHTPTPFFFLEQFFSVLFFVQSFGNFFPRKLVPVTRRTARCCASCQVLAPLTHLYSCASASFAQTFALRIIKFFDQTLP